jgi:uncharacterized surface protein with fasciclin (FAS1) repeats
LLSQIDRFSHPLNKLNPFSRRLRNCFRQKIILFSRRIDMRSVLGILVLTLGMSLGLSAQTKNGVSELTVRDDRNIVQVAIDLNSAGSPFEGQFDTLIAAVLAADPAIVTTLSGKGQFTVFAPTDNAFAALGITSGNVGDLDTDFLSSVLAYHVVRGKRFSQSVVSVRRLGTLQGGILTPGPNATLTDALGRVANIIAVDVPASNGVIHAIDTVVLPFAPSAR